MIEVDHISKVYGSTQAIQDVDFTVDEGEILGFLGPNGAGKTTTMRILAGYIPATTGTARVAGYDIHEQSMEVRRRIGYLPEHPPLYLDMSVEGFLFFVARIKGVPAGDRAQKVRSALQCCHLEDKRHQLIRKLSKGYRQRVGIAQAIVHDPPVIILDEPTVGLDPRQIIEVRNLIKSLAGQRTIILSTHILPEVSMICDRVTIISSGKVVATDTPENLQAQLTRVSGYELEISGDLNLVKTQLESIPGVIEITTFPLQFASEERLALQISTMPEQELGCKIATIIVQAGLKLHEMRRARPTLEDVFLELTTQESEVEAMEKKYEEAAIKVEE